MMRIFMLLISIIIVMSLGATSAFAQATKWPINSYKIRQHAPGETQSAATAAILQRKIDEGQAKGLTTDQVNELEQYFVEVGNEYQRLGFLEPQIETLTKSGDSFEIFVFDYDDKAGPARYGPMCSSVISLLNGDRYIRMDMSKILNGSKFKPKAYQDGAHEMFHAIQQSYPLFKNNFEDCKLGGWIYEGTADALGMDIALTLRAAKINDWGHRNYAKALRVIPDNNDGYQSSSLWRYIGEYISNGKKFPLAKQAARPDYKFLQDFFENEIDNPNKTSELDWLDDNLDEHLKLSLANLYANFVTTFAHYVPDRITPKTNKSPGDFQDRLFQGCERVTLTADITSFDTVGRKFDKVSARCFEVFYEGPEDKLDIGIYMESNKKTVNSVQQIGVQYHTGNGGKTIKVLKALKGNWSPDEHYGDWVFQNVPFVRHSRKRTRSNIFVISNVSKRASETHPNPIVSFNVSYAKSAGTMTVTQTGP